jgi:hypothetical protein
MSPSRRNERLNEEKQKGIMGEKERLDEKEHGCHQGAK